MKRFIAALLVLLFLGAGPAVAGTNFKPAPTPGCVNYSEVWNAPYPLSKYKLEKLWGVTNQGEFIGQDQVYYQYNYYRCGHLDADLNDDNAPHVSVVYNNTTKTWEYMDYV